MTGECLDLAARNGSAAKPRRLRDIKPSPREEPEKVRIERWKKEGKSVAAAEWFAALREGDPLRPLNKWPR